MSDLARQMERLRGKVGVDWTPERERDARQGFHRLRRRRAVTRTAGAAVAALLVVAGGGMLARRAMVAPGPEVAQNDRVLRFDDGSVAELKDAASVARTTVAPGRTVVEIVRGGARFDVVHNEARVFRVEAGAVAVEDLGTRFTVDRDGPDGQVLVAVQEGRVRVLAPGRTLELGAGQSGTFSQEEPEDDLELGPPSTVPTPSAQPKRPAWKSLAQGGDYSRAFKALRHGGFKAVPDDPADLFLASDVARMSGHPSEAVDPLRRIVSNHRRDPRASLAAFTLGRVLLDDLGQPREAALAFADAERLAPEGQLAEDALAREVEAWSKGGDTARAHERASLYLERYPSGTRARTVRRFGGLE